MGHLYRVSARGKRIGFYVRDFASEVHNVIAGTYIESEYRVGRYFVGPEQLNQ
ncbi:MAG: hypothetical protein ACUVV4_00250 [Candidatus Bathyarchaeia archaeon]